MLETGSQRAAVVIGGYVNAYSIVRELSDEGVSNIVLLNDHKWSIARWSNKISFYRQIDKSSESLRRALTELKEKFDFLVLYPTDDNQLENLVAINDHISDFCFVPTNTSHHHLQEQKAYQYEVCERAGLRVPSTIYINKIEDIQRVYETCFPVLIKPSTRNDITSKSVLRNIYIKDKNSLEKSIPALKKMVEGGSNLLCTEFIPGADDQIYAYTCFRSPTGEIINEWVGRKLSQFPNSQGVFASAVAEGNATVRDIGRKLVNTLDAVGIVEPEFKFDSRDGTFALMEVNLRPMMWHRAGYLGGVSLMATQYRYATGEPIERQVQKSSGSPNLCLMLHELPNLVARPGYLKVFLRNLLRAPNRSWAIFSWSDPGPFLFSLFPLSRYMVKACLRRFDLL